MSQAGPVIVTVIVPSRNEIRHIDRFLDSLRRQEFHGLDLEVLIADGMSDDGTRQVLLAQNQTKPTIRIIDNPQRLVSTGLNRAISEARGEIIIRMDVHTEYARDYVWQCVEVLSATGADNVGGPALTRADGFLARGIAVAYHTRFACGGAKFHNPEYEGYVDTVTYGCWRKSTFDRIGLFDEALDRNQDDELNLRLVRAGGKVWQSRKIVSWYRPRATLSQLFRQYLQYGFWKVAVIRKHRTPASLRHLVPAAFVLSVIGLPACAACSIVAGSSVLEFSFLKLWLGLAGLYTVISLGASFFAARRNGWRLLPVLPIVFATYHLSYGLGFLLGLVQHPGNRSGAASIRKLVTDITH
jgi:succinoglycan biosynthesis protein ExoA